MYCLRFDIAIDLKNHGIAPDPMFEMGEATFAMDDEELMKFEQGKSENLKASFSCFTDRLDDRRWRNECRLQESWS